MKYILLFVTVFSVVSMPVVASAHMMDFNVTGVSSSDPIILGQEWMQHAMGTNYNQYKEEMTDMMGPEFFSQMQEMMGKSIVQNKEYLLMPMMGEYGSYRWDDGKWEKSDMMRWGNVGNWMHLWWGWGAGFVGVFLMVVGLAIPLGILAIIILLIVKLAKTLRK